jgi:hypothetical protein
MYLIRIQPEEKRISITYEDGCGIEMVPSELYAISGAYEREDWDTIRECCENALAW